MANKKYLDQVGLECLAGLIKTELAKKQKKGDYATLENGKVPASMLPNDGSGIVEFDYTISDATLQMSSLSNWDAIVYVKSLERFVAAREEDGSDGSIPLPGQGTGRVTKFYDNWTGKSKYQSDFYNIPHSNLLFVDKQTSKTYHWNGTQLELIASDLALGHTNTTAFPGNEGVDLQTRMSKVEKDIKGLVIPKMKTMTEAEYSELSVIDPDTYYMLTEE